MKTVFPAVNSSKLFELSSTALLTATRLRRIATIDFMLVILLRFNIFSYIIDVMRPSRVTATRAQKLFPLLIRFLPARSVVEPLLGYQRCAEQAKSRRNPSRLKIRQTVSFVPTCLSSRHATSSEPLDFKHGHLLQKSHNSKRVAVP